MATIETADVINEIGMKKKENIFENPALYEDYCKYMKIPMISDEQRAFDYACKEGDLVRAKACLSRGVKLEGICLGLAASFPKDMAVFNWLLENDCPVNGDTWLYVATADNSEVRTQEIYERKKQTKSPCDLKTAGVHAASNLNQPMLTYVVSQTGWLPLYIRNINPACSYAEQAREHHQNFVKWVTDSFTFQ